MWKQDTQNNDPVQPRTAPVLPASTPMVTESKTMPRPLTTGADAEQALIGKSIIVKGEITGSGNLYIDGTVEGKINLPEQHVIVGGTGKVAAKINARQIVVHGTINGNVEASELLDLRRDGSLIGDALAFRISIEDGAFFKGKLERRRNFRHKVTAPVHLSRNGQQVNATLSNLSETGMTVVPQEPLESGSKVEFSIHLPEGPLVKGSGEIIWSNAEGIGVQFQSLSDGSDLELSRWLAKFADKADASVST